MGVKQLEKFENFEKKRKKNFEFLKDAFSSISNISVIGGDITDGRAYYCLIAKIEGGKENRDRIANQIKAKGVQTSVYYPHPVPRLSYYSKKYGYSSQKFKNSEGISDETIAFSIGPHLGESEISQIVSILKGVI